MKSNPTPFIIAILIAAAGVYWYISTGTGNQIPLTANEPVNQAQTKFQTLVSELKSISFNTTIFSDSRFNALVDFTTPVSPETTGRLDPFAPIAGISGN